MGFLDDLGKMAKQHGPGIAKFVAEQAGGSASDSSPTRNQFSADAAKAVPALVTMFSGCKDGQTSADVSNVQSFGLPTDCGPAGAGGACTHALLKYAYSQQGEFTYKELLVGMREILRSGGYSQIPQMSSSRQLNLDEAFTVGAPAAGGKKRALLIGINYGGQKGELRGCHNDVDSMLKYLKSAGFADGSCEVRVMRDNGSDEQPTSANILNALAWLAHGAAAGDALFLHYSGHGGRMKDDNGDEADGYDETLIPLDFETAGQMRDDLLHKTLIMRLPEGCKLTAVMDCCHSGTVFDLPYELMVDKNVLDQLLSGKLGQLLENQGFFGQAVKGAIRWVGENPDQAKAAAGLAMKMARGMKLF